jgi:hypothetical protein
MLNLESQDAEAECNAGSIRVTRRVCEKIAQYTAQQPIFRQNKYINFTAEKVALNF